MTGRQATRPAHGGYFVFELFTRVWIWTASLQ
jgi:hypothetical protein